MKTTGAVLVIVLISWHHYPKVGNILGSQSMVTISYACRLESKPLPSFNLVVSLSTKRRRIYQCTNSCCSGGFGSMGSVWWGVPSLGTWTARSLRVATTWLVENLGETRFIGSPKFLISEWHGKRWFEVFDEIHGESETYTDLPLESLGFFGVAWG